MLKSRSTLFYYDLSAYQVPDYDKFETAVLQYQFVAYNKAQQIIGKSEVFGDIAFGR